MFVFEPKTRGKKESLLAISQGYQVRYNLFAIADHPEDNWGIIHEATYLISVTTPGPTERNFGVGRVGSAQSTLPKLKLIYLKTFNGSKMYLLENWICAYMSPGPLHKLVSSSYFSSPSPCLFPSCWLSQLQCCIICQRGVLGVVGSVFLITTSAPTKKEQSLSCASWNLQVLIWIFSE